MNKKLLFAAMSLAALTACNSDDFENQQIAEQAVSPVQFEVLNNNDAFTRASMNGNTVEWNVTDGDLFTLYHGAAVLGDVDGYQNATYEAKANDGGTATLTTPSMILNGAAIMVWPVDSNFRIKAADKLTLTIPTVQGGKDENGKEIIQNQIPYVSDQITIYKRVWDGANPAAEYPIGADNTAGYNRKYSVYMRPMASQLNLNADYAGTDAALAELYTGDDPIEEIKVTSVELSGTTMFTKEIPVAFDAPDASSKWNTVDNQTWGKVTKLNVGGIVAGGQTTTLETKCLNGNDGCKFLILPQAAIAPADGIVDGAVTVKTNYGNVVISAASYGDDYNDAWWRYTKSTTALFGTGGTKEVRTATTNSEGKFKTTANIAIGLGQTIDAFNNATVSSDKSPVFGEPVGTSATRYVKVLLDKLQLDGTHIKSDKQLRDIVRVWKHLGAGSNVTVYLDGDKEGNFEISQKTIKVINDINADDAITKTFSVMPCTEGGEECEKIVITGGGDIQNLIFVKKNGTAKADVVFKAGETWNWKGTVILSPSGDTGVKSFINKGTMVNDAAATLAVYNNVTPTPNALNIPFVNDGTWEIKAGKVNVQFAVTNNGTVKIYQGAEYRQDGAKFGGASIFLNEAKAKPSRFGGDDSKIGKVSNGGTFATIADGVIDNFGLIEHENSTAKTYVTHNQTYAPTYAAASFTSAFKHDAETLTNNNKMGRINVKWDDRKSADNLSVSAGLAQGFISLTIDREISGELTKDDLGTKINYVIINKGVSALNKVQDGTNVHYLEINQPGTELAWKVSGTELDGLMILSDVNIKQGTEVVVKGSVYLAKDKNYDATMYVGGHLYNEAKDALPSFVGYFGDTSGNVGTNYVTY